MVEPFNDNLSIVEQYHLLSITRLAEHPYVVWEQLLCYGVEVIRM
jgi:hypothetical protein